MVKVTIVQTDGNKVSIDANEGDTLMQAAVANGIDGILAECGGSMMCATCHVYVDDADFDRLEPRSEAEDEMLDSTVSKRKENSRLSCQIKLGTELEGITVHLPQSQ